jgi:hypothetical protein
MFGWSLVRTKDYEELLMQRHRTSLVYRWFVGWKDLDIIWDYVMGRTFYKTIEHTRGLYAQARGTDEYGNPKSTGKRRGRADGE